MMRKYDIAALLKTKVFVNPYIEAHREQQFHPEDKGWMTDRKKEWRLIKKNLKYFHYVKNSVHKELKHWYFYGKPTEGNDSPAPLGGLDPMFWLWFWPEKSLDAYNAILKEECHRWSGCRNVLGRILDHSVVDFPDEYGMFGGREELFIRALMPYLRWDKPLPTVKDQEIIHSFGPQRTIVQCFSHTFALVNGFDANPFAPGQYLWDHLNYAFEHNLDLCVKDDYWEKHMYQFKVLMRLLLNFNEREGVHKDKPMVVNLRNTLVERFSQRGFCEPIMTMWDEQVSDHNSNVPVPKSLY